MAGTYPEENTVSKAMDLITELRGFAEGSTSARASLMRDAADTIDQALTLLRDMVDPDPCWFDHRGGCQAHGYLSLEQTQMCPHEEAKQMLADPRSTEPCSTCGWTGPRTQYLAGDRREVKHPDGPHESDWLPRLLSAQSTEEGAE